MYIFSASGERYSDLTQLGEDSRLWCDIYIETVLMLCLCRHYIIIIITISPHQLSSHVLYGLLVTPIFRRIFLSFLLSLLKHGPGVHIPRILSHFSISLHLKLSDNLEPIRFPLLPSQ